MDQAPRKLTPTEHASRKASARIPDPVEQDRRRARLGNRPPGREGQSGAGSVTVSMRPGWGGLEAEAGPRRRQPRCGSSERFRASFLEPHSEHSKPSTQSAHLRTQKIEQGERDVPLSLSRDLSALVRSRRHHQARGVKVVARAAAIGQRLGAAGARFEGRSVVSTTRGRRRPAACSRREQGCTRT
jgi:hypothetical protein